MKSTKGPNNQTATKCYQKQEKHSHGFDEENAPGTPVPNHNEVSHKKNKRKGNFSNTNLMTTRLRVADRAVASIETHSDDGTGSKKEDRGSRT